MEKITDPKRPITKADHGRIIKVGKKNFARIVIPGLPKFWETGHDGVIETTKGWKSYKLTEEEGEKILTVAK